MLFGGRPAWERALRPRLRRPDGPDGSIEGSCSAQLRPNYLMSTAVRKAAMSAEILKRKLRNFPVASLNERIATS
jgi:hypothetical protein